MTALSKATITIKEIYPPSGKGPSRVLDGAGSYWKVWADVLDELNLKKGSTYDIGYKADTYNGKPDNTIKAAVTADTGAIYASTSGAQSATNGRAAALDGHAAPLKDEIIGALAILKGYVGVGAVALDDDRIAEALLKCLRGYRKFLQLAAAE